MGVGRRDVSRLSSDLAGVADDHAKRIGRLAESQESVADEVRQLADDLAALRRDATGHLRQLTEELQPLHERIEVLDERIAVLDERARETTLPARIAPTMVWIANDDVPEGPLVSVILPTRNRAALLRRAIDSVVAQSYQRWELLVVDDGSEDQTPQVLASVSDSRLRPQRTDGVGVGAARNLGLEAAAGDIVAYLDDDNLMYPEWLRSVVWALARRPDAEVLYGARIVDEPALAGLSTEGLSAPIVFLPYDRARLERGNYIDLGVIAHRAGLPEATFDETLATHGDWDLMLRLTKDRPPLALPVIASLYTTSAPGRLDEHPNSQEDRDRVVARVRDTRRLRILGYNWVFPLISETYIEEEMETLADQGADIAYCRTQRPPLPMPVPRPVFDDLDVALRHFAPDLLFLHWTERPDHEFALLRRLGLPFAVRSHSFDFDPERSARIMSEPNCIGLWAFPAHAEVMPGAHSLPAMLRSVDSMPDPAPVRDAVVSVSAGLPKKDWDLMISAMAALPGVDRRIITAVTPAFEDVPDQLSQKLAGFPDPPRLQVNVPRAEVFDILARTAVLLYTLEPGNPFGNPMSIIEGLCAGASVVVPDRPEVLEFAGPRARGYRTSEDIVRHAREVLAGGPEIEDEWRENRAYGRERFCDELVAKSFFAEVTEALERWRAGR
jgi:glycosyltransferase involved in cell wall biosynthesis